MTKILKPVSLCFIVIALLLNAKKLTGQQTYELYVDCLDYDSAFVKDVLNIQTQFVSQDACRIYVAALPQTLKNQGFVTANIDSTRFDSLSAYLVLYAGNLYQWTLIDVGSVDPNLLQSVGWQANQFNGKSVDLNLVESWQQNMLNHLEKTGYPFAKVWLDSLQFENGQASANLKVDQGPLYIIDSIRIYGDVKISNMFLQRYLGINNGSIYDKQKLDGIAQKIRELNFIEEERPSNLTLLGTGSVLNLYLKPRRSSQVNVLVGFLPGDEQTTGKKFLITGEANILLKNALAAGETIGLNWQQLQAKSPRLNLLYQHPYILNSPVGVDFNFDMFRKDSTFLNVNFQLGARYDLSTTQQGKVFIQKFQTIVSGINIPLLLQTRRLPNEADVSLWNLGIDYALNTTNYRFNPLKGNLFNLMLSIGNKTIKKNNEVLELKDPNNPGFEFATLYDTVKLKSYQLRSTGSAARYFPIGKQGTFKTGISAGFLHSENLFRNELFQIGGFKLLRGFDEESQYLSQYAIGSFEYRYLVGLNSYFYAFIDGGFGRNKSQSTNLTYSYAGTGAGLALETKVGIFNIALAVGKRNDLEFNLRQSKIHFGFLNFF
jgi:outer membrane protein assembly factor BamA